jgi:hypothetical protein
MIWQDDFSLSLGFKDPEDFEKAFRPTKWSIRKYTKFVLAMGYEHRDGFVNYTLEILSNSYTDKDTCNFLKQIKQRRKNNFGVEMFGYYHHESASIKTRSTNQFIEIMAGLHKKGVIQCSVVRLAEILKNEFNVKYALSTIKDKIYKYESDSD